MIKSKNERVKGKLELDLTGPQGNAFCLLGYAQSLAKELGKDKDDILKRMQESDYENLVDVFEQEFGDHVTLWR